MNNINISELKTNPSNAITLAEDFPVGILNRNDIKAYLIGKDLFEQLVGYLEDTIDGTIIRDTDFSKGEDFDTFAKEFSI
jgi:hypothetical protein